MVLNISLFLFLQHHVTYITTFKTAFLQRLQRNDRAMIRQICSIKPEDVARVRSSELLASACGPRPHFEREKASLVWACGAFEWCNQNSI